MNSFIEELEKLNLFLVEQNGDLILKGRKGQLTQKEIELIRQNGYITDFIRKNKAELIRHLAAEQLRQRAIYKLSPLQEGMLFHYLYDSDSRVYIEQFAVDLPAGVNAAALEKAWGSVIRKHSILRTGFIHDRTSVPLQVVHPELDFAVQETDLTAFDADQLEKELERLLDQDLSTGFDLQTPPLMRVNLIKMGEKAWKMVWTYHHILLDGWSLPIVVNELLTAYEAYCEGKAPALQGEDLFEDYIKYLNRQEGYKAEAFWKKYLDGFETPSLLPFTNSRLDRNKGGATVKKVQHTFDAVQTAAIKDYAQSRNITVNTLIQGVWSVLLSYYSGNQDIAFGVTVSGRPMDLEDADRKVGLFINILPFRAVIRPGDRAGEWFSAIQEGHAAAREYQYQALNEIQQWSGITGDFFDSLLVFENYPVDEAVREKKWALELGDVRVQEQTNYLLTIVAGMGNTLDLKFIYNNVLLDDVYAEMISRHFAALVARIAISGQEDLSGIRILTDEEEKQLIAESGSVGYPESKSLVDLFTDQAAETPDSVAVVFRDRQLSYSELDERSTRLANRLIEKGINRESLIPILLDPSPELIIAILGILKAGGAYVPVDPEYPVDRIRFIIGDTGAGTIIADRKFAGLLAEVSGAESLFMDDNSLWTGEKSPQFRQHLPAPECLAYVIYTSGSTGKPKGVLVEHKHVVRLLKTDKPLFDFTERDVWTLFHSHAFDFSVWEIFGALLFGAKLVIVPSEMRKEPRAFAQLISEQAVTVLNQTPGAFYQLQHAFTPSHNAGSLRYVIFGGEALDPALLQSWKEQYPPCRLINMYGITETTVHVTFKEIEEKDIRSGISNIGRAIPTLSCYVLDQHMRHLPAGVPGELYVAGEGVARGYLNRETLTAERFLEDPFSARGTGRIYKTGDLARRLPDGNFEYLGRIDNQVKIRGYRIELGEIEATLRTAPGVAQAVVAAKEGHDGVKRLIAYILPQGSLEKAAVQAYLRSVLPAYMVPANLIELDAFPLTRNGKIDKKALPDPEHKTGPGAHFAAPQNETEKALLDIWKGLLGVATLGTRDNFFETGGHSLLAMRVIAAVRKQLKRELRVKDIFTFPTVESLARHMEAGNRKSVLLPPVTTGKRPLRLPLSYSQERLWFIHQMGGSTQYHLPTVIRLKNQINREGLEAAFSALINRHESLRTVISQEDGQPFQTVLSAEGWKMAFSEQTSPENGNSPDQFISEEISRPFNLSKDFPLRARLIRYGNNDHCLVIVLHHIASDGWSESVLVRDLTELYNAYVENRPAALAPLQVQYADYAIWQRQHLSDRYLESLLDWWEARLKGVEPIKLPTDYRRPAVQSHRGANWGLPLDKALSAAIKDLSIRMGTTPFMTMLAAFKVLLYRYSGQQDICVGTPVANRNAGELDQLAGFFVNTIALRTQIDGNRQADELLKQIKEESLAAFSRQEAPFEQIVLRVVADRSLSRSPVFQVMFIMQNNPETPDLKLNGLDLSFEAPGGQTAQFDLTFSLVEADGQFYLGIEYCTDLFTPETIERMAGHFIQLAGSFVAAPETRVDNLRMTTETEENLLRKVFNQTVEPFPDNLTLVDLFCSQAGQTPDLIAAAFEGETITYRELDRRSNALARFLKKAGAGPETLVAICIGRSLEMITGILGILKAGGAYVPVDPEYPGHRINYLLEDTGARIAVSVRDFAHLLAGENKIKTILLDEDWPEIALESGDRVEAGIKPENLAYVIYTSGSTGRPKGVMNQHSGVVNRLLWGKKTFGLEPGKDAVLQKTTFSFDVSVWEIFWPLISGAQLVLARPGGHKDNAYVKSLISSRAITTVHFVPSMLEVFLQDLEQGELPGLRQVFCSGEELKPAHVDLFAQRLPHVELHNLYGPTETAIEVSWLHLPAGQDRKAETVTIGKPIANTALYVGSPNGQLSGIGVPGELLIGGIQVARGYLNRQAVTTEKFIPNPFAADGSGSRLYRSGDLARVLPDGQVEFLGRIDTQVKIRGYRIELSEIEFVLRQLPGIRQCAVMAKTGENVNPGLIAYVVRDRSAMEADGLDGKVRDWLKERLPDYMVPAVVAELNELPLTANGKLDVKALPETAHWQEAAKTYMAPDNATESALAEIWAKLLRLDRVSVSDNFFEIGGHSLLAMRMISAVRRELNAELEVLDVFTHPTVREMAARLNENDLKPVLPPPAAGERPDEIPLSYSQERLWFIDQLEGSIHYHQPTILRIRSEVDISILEKALGALVERHEVLRTVFRVKTGQPYQVILPAGGWKLSFSADKAFADKSHLQSFIAAEVRKPFDLTADYMLRASLVKSGDNDFTLILVRHHIASDGWSESILVSDLAALYSAAKNGRKPDLPRLPVQYADYAIWQRKHQSGAYLEAHLGWWKNHLRELEPLELPTDFPRPTIRSTRGATMRFRIDSGLTNQLKDLANNSGATLFMTLVAAYKVLLFKYSGQEDICIGTPLANRNYKELEPVVGFFINNLVLRTSLEGGPGFRELLQRVKTSTLSAFRHQDVPFEQIVDEIEKNRNLSRNPIFQVTFAMQNTPDIPEMVLEGLDVSFESSAHSASRFDMNFSVTETRQGLAVAIEYCSDLFTESRIAGMAAHFEELLRSAVADPEMPVGRLKMLSQEEERQVVFGFNETEFEFPQDKTLMELFRAQVAETPDNIAAVFEEKTLTYRELDRLSNRFGHYLRQNFPIAPDDRIAIKIERSEWMLVTIFGILKAGGAYVPIDTAFPEDRVAFMLEDSAAKVLIDERELQKFWTEQAQHPDTAPVSGTTPGNLAYVIYTSGSTGKAKGVQIEHRTVVSEILYLKEKFRISEKDRVLQTANYVFDPSVEQIFIALLSGATLVLIRKETLLDKDRMEEILTKERVTYLHTTP
nr:amino acid adenylation domain-containing protein [Flavilitoribacter sp.]